jgi:hypothetical protein
MLSLEIARSRNRTFLRGAKPKHAAFRKRLIQVQSTLAPIISLRQLAGLNPSQRLALAKHLTGTNNEHIKREQNMIVDTGINPLASIKGTRQ